MIMYVRMAAIKLFLLCCALQSLLAQDTAVIRVQPVDEKRVSQIAALLPARPAGFGDPIEQRVHWDSLYATGIFSRLIVEADSISSLPFPKLTEEIYMSFYGGKDSETSKRFIMKRRMLLTRLVWAECLTNKGKYLNAIIEALEEVVSAPSWTFPAEDREKTNWEGKEYTIGLSSSAYGSDLAQSLYLLNTKLPDALKQRIHTALQQKLFTPVLNAVTKGNHKQLFHSLTDQGNHNPVTLANVLGAAFAVLDDKKQRATFAAIAEKYSDNYLLSFLDDGYCTEGMNYYSYGFGHYVFLRELFWQATKGRIDLFQKSKVAKMARFAPAMEIINGVYPTISDCEQDIKPAPQLMFYLNKEQGLGLPEYDQLSVYMDQPALCYLMYFFPNAVSDKAKPDTIKGLDIRDYFKDAGVLTVRPLAGSTLNMGATFKGGNNAEQHNHNDIGSYTIVVGDELLTGDPGLATYTPKYFGKERYTAFKTTTSYGHNVPLINGIQQRFGSDAQAKVIRTDFSDKKDVLAMDLSSAYDVPGLQKLQRTFTYNRTGKNGLVILDEFAFEKRGVFETALITRFPWKKIEDKILVSKDGTRRINSVILEITGSKEKIRVAITTSVEGMVLFDELINEAPQPFTRIALKLPPAKTGFIAVRFLKNKISP